jgi:hypothetical protein
LNSLLRHQIASLARHFIIPSPLKIMDGDASATVPGASKLATKTNPFTKDKELPVNLSQMHIQKKGFGKSKLGQKCAKSSGVLRFFAPA